MKTKMKTKTKINASKEAKSKKTPTICLNMIVKDEAHIIESTLINLWSYIKFDYYVISDTGSSDQTKAIIASFFQEKGVKGEIIDNVWQDFAANRTLALRAAYRKTDYVMVFDADDSIEGKFNIDFLTLTPADSYSLKFGPALVYYRTLIVSNKLRWKYTSILHEYIECEESCGPCVEVTSEEYHFVSGRLGNRSKNPNKYRDDALILQKGYDKETKCGGKLQSRYAFYAAQSFRDALMSEESITMYKTCLGLGGWHQEKYIACIELGHLYERSGDVENALTYFTMAIDYDANRIEGVVLAMILLRSKNRHKEVNTLYRNHLAYKKPANSAGLLFLRSLLYDHAIEYNNSISACYTEDKLSGYICCKKILTLQIAPPQEIMQTMANFRFYENFLVIDKHREKLDIVLNAYSGNTLGYMLCQEAIAFYKRHFPDMNITQQK